MTNRRRGMLIKNTHEKPVEITMKSRTLRLGPGEERFITAEEVRDEMLRENLQVRAISIVRPTTETEEVELRKKLEEGESE